jgi:hypothetical protein
MLCPVELQRLGGKGQDLRRERESNAQRPEPKRDTLA